MFDAENQELLMRADLEDFNTGWHGLTPGIGPEEIDKLIAALKHLKEKKEHFHFRSNYEGAGGIGDIEVYFTPDESNSNLGIEIDFRK